MSKVRAIHFATMVCASLASVSVSAQSTTSQDHSAHQEIMSPQSQGDKSKVPLEVVDPHAGHAMPGVAADPHAGHNMMQGDSVPQAPMDHGEMQMQGGSAPPDARDPHAYSNGLQVGKGDYAVPGVPHLMLADEHTFASFRAERLERKFDRNGDDSTGYDMQGWFGTTYDRFVIKAEGDVAKSKVEESRTELLWSHAIATHWDTQLGVRLDTGEGQNRQWMAFGIQGLSPYWFEVDATAYLGNGGRTAVRLEASYELLITQRLVLEPKIEMQAFGKSDPERGIGSGLSEASAGLRLRYEFSRQFAPYIGVERAGTFGETADYVRAEGGRTKKTRVVAGLRFWF